MVNDKLQPGGGAGLDQLTGDLGQMLAQIGQQIGILVGPDGKGLRDYQLCRVEEIGEGLAGVEDDGGEVEAIADRCFTAVLAVHESLETGDFADMATIVLSLYLFGDIDSYPPDFLKTPPRNCEAGRWRIFVDWISGVREWDVSSEDDPESILRDLYTFFGRADSFNGILRLRSGCMTKVERFLLMKADDAFDRLTEIVERDTDTWEDVLSCYDRYCEVCDFAKTRRDMAKRVSSACRETCTRVWCEPGEERPASVVRKKGKTRTTPFRSKQPLGRRSPRPKTPGRGFKGPKGSFRSRG